MACKFLEKIFGWRCSKDSRKNEAKPENEQPVNNPQPDNQDHNQLSSNSEEDFGQTSKVEEDNDDDQLKSD